MSDAENDSIALGDCVEVVQWPCCNAFKHIGDKFRVNAMEKARSGFMRCTKCGKRHESAMDALGPSADWNPVAWLKKIPCEPGIKEGTRLE